MLAIFASLLLNRYGIQSHGAKFWITTIQQAFEDPIRLSLKNVSPIAKVVVWMPTAQKAWDPNSSNDGTPDGTITRVGTEADK